MIRKRIGETEIHGIGWASRRRLARRLWRLAKDSLHNAEHHFVGKVAGCCAIPSQKPLRQDALAGGRGCHTLPETNDPTSSGFLTPSNHAQQELSPGFFLVLSTIASQLPRLFFASLSPCRAKGTPCKSETVALL